jgi:hypothetical protein
MFLSTLLKLRDASAGQITAELLEEAAASVPVAENDLFGECLPWVLLVVQKLHEMGFLSLVEGNEFSSFADGNRAFATRAKFPNVKVIMHASCIRLNNQDEKFKRK